VASATSGTRKAPKRRAGIVSAGGKAIAIRADVCQGSEIRRLVKSAADELGPIDILVNNAGRWWSA